MVQEWDALDIFFIVQTRPEKNTIVAQCSASKNIGKYIPSGKTSLCNIQIKYQNKLLAILLNI